MELGPYDYILAIDLEATCCDKKTILAEEMEIIEIGAVMVVASDLTKVGEFQTFIKPVRHKTLTPFCLNLTSIKQAEVETAPEYLEAIKAMHAWMKDFPNYVFGSWGDFDRRQFMQDAKYHKSPYPFNKSHVNLKKVFSKKQGYKRHFGMKGALGMAELPLIGTHHRGIDDARNLAQLLPFILGRQKVTKKEPPQAPRKSGPGPSG